MKSNNKKKGNAGETILWMVLTAATVFIITSFQYTNMSLGNDELETSDEDFVKLKKVLKIVEEDYLYEYDMKDLEEGAIRGLLEALDDPYTNYFDAEETEEFLTETEGEYEGVGIYLSIDTNKNWPIVLLPIEGSPAEEAGVLPGDYIIEIDGKDVRGVSIEEVSAGIKGAQGSKVTIKFIRYTSETEYEEIEKTITRRKVELNAFGYEMLEDNIAYIKFESFDENIADKFNAAYEEMNTDGKVEGLIIDLRNNTGGLLTVAKDIIDTLLPTGIITYTVDRDGNKEYLYSDSEEIAVPIVVIVNENSASASEIMAAAVKDSENGKVVGTTTYGKGLVQEFKSLRDGTYVKVTISEYFSPKGNKINEIGVEPNFVLEDNEETENDEQLEKAVEVIKEMK